MLNKCGGTNRRLMMVLLAALPLAGCGVIGGGDGGPKTPTIGNRVSILSNDASVKLDPTIAGQAVLVPDAQSNADWPQSGGNAAKSMSHVALGNNRTQIWSADIAGNSNTVRLASPPVVGGGRLVAVGTDAVVHAFAADTGASLWRVSIGSEERDFARALFGGGVAIDGNFVYATSGAGDVAALNAETGALVWKVKPAGPLRGAPTVAFGSLYVMTQDNQMLALAASDGAVQWQASASL